MTIPISVLVYTQPKTLSWVTKHVVVLDHNPKNVWVTTSHFPTSTHPPVTHGFMSTMEVLHQGGLLIPCTPIWCYSTSSLKGHLNKDHRIQQKITHDLKHYGSQIISSHGRLASTNSRVSLICVSPMPIHGPKTLHLSLVLNFLSPRAMYSHPLISSRICS
jgi:hypothetical protein